MKKLTFIFGVHNHQPVGNFSQVFETLYRQSYEPFLRALNRHPAIKCTFHITGSLLEWLDENRPEYIRILREMADRGQIEFFTGGMYEPILSILPDRDKLGQIRMMTQYLREKFKADARGMWMAERVWEPHLTKSLAEAGVRYVVVDDAHFKAVGLTEEETFFYYLMEEQGETCAVFPISEKMRYLMPFRSVEESLQYIQSVATEEGDRCLVLMDDGEKFGGWPDTYKWVYEDGYLEKFFVMLEQNATWLQSSTFSEFVSTHLPQGHLSLPTGSYTEMGEWSLPVEASREYGNIRRGLKENGQLPRFDRFLKGGIWRNFLAKYDESNHLHKKLLWVSSKLEEARRTLGKKEDSKKRAVLEKAERALYRGQCNCAYWHGVFGGLYLNHLRFALYQNLIEAEKLADSILPLPPKGFRVDITDFNKDGKDEIMITSTGYHVVLQPSAGGTLIELDYLKRPINLCDTLTRRKEAYHSRLLELARQNQGGGAVSSIHDILRTKEQGLENRLFYDMNRRASLVDRFLSRQTTPEDLWASRAGEISDFLKNTYDFKVLEPKRKGGNLTVRMSRQGQVEGAPLYLEKNLEFSPGAFSMDAEYSLVNRGDHEIQFLWMVEWNLTLLAGDAPDRNYFVAGRSLASPRLNSMGEETGVLEMGMRDGWLGIEVNFKTEKSARFWRYPVETISQSEGGFERVYQGSCLLLGWNIGLKPGESFKNCVKTELKETKNS